ncbi:hypothetical protein AR543_17035 [Paenibacillus bovis]|uniref:Uncharacterized protein n=1 Tax=Paenibacillus bovis TaxID=1616788 RepID=A0A172ZJ24_9BACL|nr:hypothetical protein AR543_17035 [Paenibacillus bovis]
MSIYLILKVILISCNPVSKIKTGAAGQAPVVVQDSYTAAFSFRWNNYKNECILQITAFWPAAD